MKTKVEKFRVEEFSLEKIFNPDFISKLKKYGEFFPVQTAFVRESEDENVSNSEIIFTIKNSIERKQNIVHIESSDSDVLENLVKDLK